MTKRLEVMAAARALTKEGRTTFSAADLVVASWRLFPASFSLTNYRLPDSNAVLIQVMGRKGLVATGDLIKVGVKQYGVAAAATGRKATRATRNPGPSKLLSGLEKEITLPAAESLDVLDGHFTAAEVSWLRRMLTSNARKLYADDRAPLIVISDASMFWGVRDVLNEEIREAARLLLVRAASVLEDAGAVTLVGGCRDDAGAVRAVVHLHDYLCERFPIRSILKRKLG